MRILTALTLALLLTAPTAHAEDTALQKFDGGEITAPYWFKESFLDLGDDAEEATAEDRVLMLYFHQAGCPYCFNMINQNFLDSTLAPFIQKHFDVVALDLWGDREVTLPDGQAMSEKALAAKWQIQYTPTLVFLNPDGSIRLRIDGYRPKPVFTQILDYAINPATDYALANTLIKVDADEEMYAEPFLIETNDLTTLKGEFVVVMLEYPGCDDCEALHRNVIARPAVYDLLEKYKVVRFDAASDEELVRLDGSKTTPDKWVKELGLTYYPSVLLFDRAGQERFRIGGYVQAFHFATALDYVLSGGYQQFPEFQRYLNDRADRLREAGKTVIITE